MSTAERFEAEAPVARELLDEESLLRPLLTQIARDLEDAATLEGAVTGQQIEVYLTQDRQDFERNRLTVTVSANLVFPHSPEELAP